MYLANLQLQNMRCFANQSFELSPNITLIEGNNGSGKTSIIEALYYLCYLRSFRTHLTKELISFEGDGFFIKATLGKSQEYQQLQAGFTPAKRLVKLDSKTVSSYKELLECYRVIALTEDDLSLVKGSPEERRNFIDQYVYLQDFDWLATMRDYRKTLESRNALLKSRNYDNNSYQIWTDQLQSKSLNIRNKRIEALRQVEEQVNKLLNKYFNDDDLAIELLYKERAWSESAAQRERFGDRSLFGAHLDDFQIKLDNKASRRFASRGQQKLIAILMKIAQVYLLKQNFNGVILFLLDDFMTDFDEIRIKTLITLLKSLEIQLIFTTPTSDNFYKKTLVKHQALVISLSGSTV